MVSKLKDALIAFGYTHVPSKDGSHTFIKLLTEPTDKPPEVIHAEEANRLRDLTDAFRERNKEYTLASAASRAEQGNVLTIHLEPIKKFKLPRRGASKPVRRFD